jgi:hypothetical protein
VARLKSTTMVANEDPSDGIRPAARTQLARAIR